MIEAVVNFLSLLPYILQIASYLLTAYIDEVYNTRVQQYIHLRRAQGKGNFNQNPIIRQMDPSQSFNQPPGACSSSEKSVMLQPVAPPPAYQDNPAGYPPSFPSQPVPQGPYTQGPYSGQPVVAVQPAVFVTAAPLTNPAPDYLGYSIFTMLCCCLPLGIAALIYSCSTRDANYSGQRELAERNSKMARNLNHVGLGIGLVFTVFIIYRVVLIKNMDQYP